MEYFMDWKFPLFPFNIDFFDDCIKGKQIICMSVLLFVFKMFGCKGRKRKKRKGMCLTLVLRFNWLSFALHNQFSNIVEKWVLGWTMTQKIYVMKSINATFSIKEERERKNEKKRKKLLYATCAVKVCTDDC